MSVTKQDIQGLLDAQTDTLNTRFDTLEKVIQSNHEMNLKAHEELKRLLDHSEKIKNLQLAHGALESDFEDLQKLVHSLASK